jgi:protein tyrosine/serine phosphatase
MQLKKIVFIFLLFIAGFCSFKWYDAYVNFRFKTITEGKVYKSGAIKPEKIADFVAQHHIKSIIDLRGPVTHDTINNPEQPEEILNEKNAVEKLKNVNYFNIPSHQVPDAFTMKKFFEVMDNPDNYPVLIHCHHGIGRAQVYSALYRIEYENFTNEQAREATAFPLLFSSFDEGTPKGEFLKNYKKRNQK